MRMPERLLALVFVGALAGAAVACGGGDDGDDAANTGADTSSESPAPSDSDTENGDDPDDGSGGGSSELDAIATGLKASTMAEDVEVEGNTIHLYLAPDTLVPGGECVVVNAVIPDDATAVIHRDGEETTC